MFFPKRLLLASMLIGTFMTGTAYAYNASTEVVNNIRSGDICIGIEEYEVNDKGEMALYKNKKKTVYPGSKTSRIVRITNDAEPAWVRAKVSYTCEDGLAPLSDDDIRITSDKWDKIGDYFYYTEPVASGDYVTLFDLVKVPDGWGNEYAGKTFSIIVTADAVQEVNFTPDFNSDDPWFGTLIEQCVHTSYDMQAAEDKPFSLVFEGGSEGFIKTSEDFFDNFQNIMPGDTFVDTLEIRNNYSRNVSIYFRTETIDDTKLLGKLILTIKNGDTVIYEGPMSGEIEKDLKLGSFNKGEGTTLTYSIYMPYDLRNEYAQNVTKTKWIFSVKWNDPDNSGGGSSGRSHKGRDTYTETTAPVETVGPGPGPGPVEPTPSETVTETIVKTGEVVSFTMLVLGFILMLFAIVTRRRKDEENKPKQ